MMVGHLPAGYLASVAARHLGVAPAVATGILIGAVVPDLDMLWFALVDGGRVHHHTYLTHRPAVWVAVAVLGLAIRSRMVIGIGAGGVLHMILDTIVGAIGWAWPMSDQSTTLVVVPATQPHWILSFLLHWTFAVELALCTVALLVFLSRRRVRA